MRKTRTKNVVFAALALAVTLATLLSSSLTGTRAADHFDAPLVANDQGADIADGYFFLDPNDNTRAIVAMTVQGFIVPGEAGNAGGFDHNIRYRFEIENTGDARPDRFLDVTFSRRTGTSTPQTATVVLPSGATFTAPTTAPSLDPAPPAPVTTTNSASGVIFFAGVVDDPFVFDIPGFNRFVGGVLAGDPNAANALQRGRDTFAGYNIKAIVLSIPKTLLQGSAGNVVGLNTVTQRRTPQIITSRGETVGVGRFTNIDRMATPAINTALIPFSRKNEYNAASTIDDANGRFAGSIVGTLQALGTNQTNINILASVAVTNGDFLRLNLATANTSLGRTNPANTTDDGNGFPNGRRIGDDVVDTVLFFVANQQPVSDNANVNDVPFRTAFPYFGASQQPLENPTTDDRTRN